MGAEIAVALVAPKYTMWKIRIAKGFGKIYFIVCFA